MLTAPLPRAGGLLWARCCAACSVIDRAHALHCWAERLLAALRDHLPHASRSGRMVLLFRQPQQQQLAWFARDCWPAGPFCCSLTTRRNRQPGCAHRNRASCAAPSKLTPRHKLYQILLLDWTAFTWRPQPTARCPQPQSVKQHATPKACLLGDSHFHPAPVLPPPGFRPGHPPPCPGIAASLNRRWPAGKDPSPPNLFGLATQHHSAACHGALPLAELLPLSSAQREPRGWTPGEPPTLAHHMNPA